MDVSSHDMAILLICSVRYALGRMTYIVDDVTGICRTYAPEVDQGTLDVLKKDIREALQKAERENRTVGMAMDHEKWRQCLEDLESHHSQVDGYLSGPVRSGQAGH